MTHAVGITGNQYAYSKRKEAVEELCDLIGKSKGSIYWSPRFGGVWAIRVKDKKMKAKLKSISNGTHD